MRLGGGILCGGKSKRMRKNKALLEWNQKSFLRTIAEELSGFEQLLVSVDYKSKYSLFPYEFVEDKIQGIGPLEGIRQLLLASSQRYMFICACDMPFIKYGLAEYMSEFISSDYDCYVICDEQRVHPLCAIYSRDILPHIEEMIRNKDYRLTNLLKRVRTKYINLKQSCYSNKLIKNINTREEYMSLGRPYVFCVSGVKDSGKTWLIMQLINGFIEEFPKIGVIKHDGHDFVMDYDGTDTSRIAEAGAVKTAIFSNTRSAILHKQADISLEAMILQMSDMDMIIIEGMKSCSYPKVEIVREGISNEIVCSPASLIAAVTNTEIINLPEGIPVIPLDDYQAAAECIREKLIFGKAMRIDEAN